MAVDASRTVLQLRVGGSRLHVRVHGIGHPVLLLHGGGPGTSGEGWADCMAACPPGLQLFAPDFPGFGHSSPFDDGRPDSNAAHVAVVLDLMETLCLDRVVLVGHSMGAAVAAALAAQHPHRIAHLVLVAPGGNFYGITDYVSPGLAKIEKAALEPTEHNLRDLVALMCHGADGQEQQVRSRMRLLSRPEVLATQRRLLQERGAPSADAATARRRQAEAIRRFEAPVTLVWGAQERFNPFSLGERIRACLPKHADYIVVEGAGHNVQYEQPEAVARIFARILENLGPAAGAAID